MKRSKSNVTKSNQNPFKSLRLSKKKTKEEMIKFIRDSNLPYSGVFSIQMPSKKRYASKRKNKSCRKVKKLAGSFAVKRQGGGFRSPGHANLGYKRREIGFVEKVRKEQGLPVLPGIATGKRKGNIFGAFGQRSVLDRIKKQAKEDNTINMKTQKGGKGLKKAFLMKRRPKNISCRLQKSNFQSKNTVESKTHEPKKEYISIDTENLDFQLPKTFASMTKDITYSSPKISKQASRNKKKAISYRKVSLNISKKKRPLKKGAKEYKIKWFGNSKDFVSLKKYLVLGPEIGKGTYASVLSGSLIKCGKAVAVKIFTKARQSSSMRRMIQREVDLLLRLNHPNIVQLRSVLEDSSSVFVAMEHLGKSTLKAQEQKMPLGPIRDKEKTKGIMRGILEGLGYLHGLGICHRDLKLSNVMVKNGVAKIIDMGMACEIRGVKDYLICGTKSYFAPEMIKRVGYSGDKIDIWCLGVLMYKLCTGIYPFGDKDTENIEKVILEKTPEFKNLGLIAEEISVLKMMMDKRPASRPTVNQVRLVLTLFSSNHTRILKTEGTTR